MVLTMHDTNIDKLKADCLVIKKKIIVLENSRFPLLKTKKLLDLHKELRELTNLMTSEYLLWTDELLRSNRYLSKKIERHQIEEIQEDYGNCENCDCKLTYMPNAGWGVGYVCSSCARRLRGEDEY